MSHVAAREPPSSRDVQVGAMASFTQELKLRGTRVRTFFEDRFPNAAAARADLARPRQGLTDPRPARHGRLPMGDRGHGARLAGAVQLPRLRRPP